MANNNPTGINQYTRQGMKTRRSEIARVLTHPKGTPIGNAQRVRLAKDIRGVAKLSRISKQRALSGISKAAVETADYRRAAKARGK